MRSSRAALSSVYGFIVIFTLLMAGIGASLTIMDAQASVWRAQERAKQLQASQQNERLSLSLSGTSLAVTNVGLIPSRLLYLHQKGAQTSSDSRIGSPLQEGSTLTLPVARGMSGFAVITSLGNVFWVFNSTQPSSLPSAVPVTFDASGLDSTYASATVLSVDGLAYSFTSLPKTFAWAPNSIHNYSFVQGFATGTGQRVGWNYARGISSSRAGTLTASQPGSLVSYYSQQYLLAVTGGNGTQFTGSPSNDGWYSSGSSAQVSSNYVWNVAAGQSRQRLLGYGYDGATPTLVTPASSGMFISPSVIMNSPHTLALAAVTQYFLSVSGGNGVSYAGSQTSDGWFDAGGSGSVTTNYIWGVVAGRSRLSLVSWNLDGGANQTVTRAGSGTLTTTSITMNTFHTVNFNALTQYYVTTASSVPTSGTVGALTVSYSYNTLGTVSGSAGAYSIPAGTRQSYFTSGATVNIPVARTSYTMTVTAYESQTGDKLLFNWPNCGENSPQYSLTTSPQTFSYTSNTPGCLVASSFNIFFNGGCPDSNTGIVYTCGAITISGQSDSISYTTGVSGSLSSSSNTFTVSGTTATYSYGVGYTFPGGSTSTSWSASWLSAESYSSNNCSGGLISGNTISSSNGAQCILTTTRTGTTPIAIGASPTSDGWYDSGSTTSLSSSPTGPFTFSSWSAPSGITVASSSSASTTLNIGGYGTVTASFNVNQ